MGVGRTAPHRIRAAYARALASIPLPVRSVSAPIDEAMTVLGRAEIDDRDVHYGTITTAPRLWMAFPGQQPPIFGYITGLADEAPILHITAPQHLLWTRRADRSEALLRHGLEVWREVQRWCEG